MSDYYEEILSENFRSNNLRDYVKNVIKFKETGSLTKENEKKHLSNIWDSIGDHYKNKDIDIQDLLKILYLKAKLVNLNMNIY